MRALRPTVAVMRLGIDLDGVVANFTKGWMDFYNAEFGTDFALEDSKNWGDLVDLTHFEHIGQFWRWAGNLDGHSVFYHLEPYPGALEAIQRLSDEGHEIVIITSKPRFAYDDTHTWIERNAIPADETYILEDKWVVHADVYLDDGPHILPDLVRERPESTICRYVRAWNAPVEGAVDVADFDEFREVVESLT